MTLYSLLFIFLVGLNNYNNLLFSYKRSVHSKNLKNSPVKSTYELTRSERKKNNLPPNKYQEKIWELSMNPMTGKPDIDDLFELQFNLNKSNNPLIKSFTVPGESDEMSWISRGPSNVGGRTKGLMFDPNDKNDETVFAGAIAFLLGVYDGFFGPGTGSFFVFFFVRFLGHDFLHASAAAKALNVATNAAAICVFTWSGDIWWILVVPMAVVNIVGAGLGTAVAFRRGSGFVRNVFLVVIGALILKTGIDAYF